MNELQALIIQFLALTLDFEALDDIQRFEGLTHLTEDQIKVECDQLVKQGYVKSESKSKVYALNIDVIKYE